MNDFNKAMDGNGNINTDEVPSVSRWLGGIPKTCQICSIPLTRQFIDGKTVFGPWAIMCVLCARDQGIKEYGTGVGQLYDLETLVKVAG